MGNTAGALNQNNPNNINIPINNNQSNNTTIYDTPTTVNILKALFESKNYGFSSFSSKEHPLLVQKTINNSQQQDSMKPVQLNGDPILHEFVNNFHTSFSNFLSTDDGMVKYEIYSIQSLNSTSNDNKAKSIWLPKSMTIDEAHRVLSTILYSSDMDKTPVDLADYVIVYENIMISLENQSKELYEEILKISFRLNRVALPPFRLLIIHKSKLLLLERKESKPILKENESISILQLIMYHLVSKGSNPIENENFDYAETFEKDSRNKYWPIIEVKMGIIPWKLIHPLEHSKINKTIAEIMETHKFSIGATSNIMDYLEILKMIFMSVNGDVSYIDLISSSLSKQIQVYDYPLLVALPYDRLLLSQFCKTQCSDGRWAKGIMVDGKYYSLTSNPYTPMPELKINRGSIIYLRFTFQRDTIVDGNVSSHETDQFEISDRCNELSGVNQDNFTPTKYQYSAICDNGTVHLMFPSPAIDTIMSSQQLKQTGLEPGASSRNDTGISHLQSKLRSFNNWNKITIKTDNLEKQTDKLTNTATLINIASTFSLPPIEKPECSNCLSYLNDNNLECPHCTHVFCQLCIESSYDDITHARCCPKCNTSVELSAYRKSTIIEKFEKEGISVFQCFICKSIPEQHKLCLDPKCSTLFCTKCCKEEIQRQSSITEASNSLEKMTCLRCKKADTYESGAVSYYTVRIIEYQDAQNLESKSKLFPNTAWKEEEFLPEKGTLEENHNRIISVIQFNSKHIQFDNRKEYCPLLVIDEPSEYTCPESLRLSYWKTENGTNWWEDDKKAQFYKYNHTSIATYIPHFTDFTARNIRFSELIILDEAVLDIRYDFDFTTIDDTGKTFTRGPEPYKRPCGWYRKAIRVLGVYEDAVWLGKNRDAWPVAYHGTATTNILPILRNGFIAGGSNNITIANGARHGRGIYLSPNLLYSGHERYARPVEVNGRRYRTVFQCRVKNDSIIKHDPNIWRCIDPQDIRPYGILFKEVEHAIGC